MAPDPEKYMRPNGVYEPAWAPVFYNPKMKHNRDIAVLVLRTVSSMWGIKDPIVVEPLAGTGVRALRYAIEASAKVYASDINRIAVDIMKKNIEMNNASNLVHVRQADANQFMYNLYVERVKPLMVDIDPFGSPVPFIDSALTLLQGRGVLAVTATDVAVLSATYPKKLLRRYGVYGSKTPWEKEQALRSLISYIVRKAAEKDYAALPILAYYADYYVRAYFILKRGAKKALEALHSLGYAYTCTHCYYTWYGRELVAKKCPYCHKKTITTGPIYIGPLCSLDFMEKLLTEYEKMYWIHSENIGILLRTLKEECRIVKPYVRLDKLCSWLRVNMPKTTNIIEVLRKRGYQAVRTHFDKRALKTNAPHPVLAKTLQELS